MNILKCGNGERLILSLSLFIYLALPLIHPKAASISANVCWMSIVVIFNCIEMSCNRMDMYPRNVPPHWKLQQQKSTRTHTRTHARILSTWITKNISTAATAGICMWCYVVGNVLSGLIIVMQIVNMGERGSIAAIFMSWIDQIAF